MSEFDEDDAYRQAVYQSDINDLYCAIVASVEALKADVIRYEKEHCKLTGEKKKQFDLVIEQMNEMINESKATYPHLFEKKAEYQFKPG